MVLKYYILTDFLINTTYIRIIFVIYLTYTL